MWWWSTAGRSGRNGRPGRLGRRRWRLRRMWPAGRDVQAMYRAAAERFGGIDIIYNNAGIGGREDNVRDCPEEVFDEILSINLRGVWLGMKYGIPWLEQRGGGSIISTASVAGISGLAGIAAYCASKGGVIALTRAAAGEWAAKGIRINCICPGAIATADRGRFRGSAERRAAGTAAPETPSLCIRSDAPGKGSISRRRRCIWRRTNPASSQVRRLWWTAAGRRLTAAGPT